MFINRYNDILQKCKLYAGSTESGENFYILPFVMILTLSSAALTFFAPDYSVLPLIIRISITLSIGILIALYLKHKTYIQICITSRFLIYFSCAMALFAAYDNSRLLKNAINHRLGTFSRLTGTLPENNQWFSILCYVAAFICFFIIFTICFIAIYSLIYKFFQLWSEKLQKHECVILFTGTLILGSVIFFFYSKSNAFYELFDIIFTSDTGIIQDSNLNLFVNGNDFKQPLYPIFAAPFSMPAYVISKLLFFIPGVYLKILSLTHLFLILISLITISRMAAETTKDKVFFLLLLMTSYPVFLFTVNMEQYVVSLFWLIAFIYCSFQTGVKENMKIFLYTAGTSCMITSGIFIVIELLLKTKKSIKKSLKLFLYTTCSIIFLLRPDVIYNFIPDANLMLRFSSLDTEVKYSFYYSFCQFTDFVVNCFFAPETVIMQNEANNISIQSSVPDKISLYGIMILLIVITGFWLNRKNKIAILSFIWIIFSFILLAIIGYGSPENGMILYTFYFSWAYYILFFLFIKSVTAKAGILKYAIIIPLIISQLIINSKGMMNILSFAEKYYPIQ